VTAGAPPPRRVALVGTGVIGAGWAARCLARGLDVTAWDPAPDAEARLRRAVANAWPAVRRLGLAPGASPDRLAFAPGLEACVEGADLVQESAPEREELKRDLLARVGRACPPGALVASSTSGLLPSRLQADMPGPERFVVGHPFNPVYLLPLVEVVGGRLTSGEAKARAVAAYEALGMHPLLVRTEIDGFLADRLLEALWREALHLVNDDVATVDEVDRAVCMGPGLRWAFMGSFLTYRLGGGEAGMRHFMAQFGPALKLPWTRLEAPELTDELVEKVAAQSDAQAAGRSVAELERLRDDCLVDIMRALERYRVGAGAVLAADPVTVRKEGDG
jgi:carnitine 3-dehydrogenase